MFAKEKLYILGLENAKQGVAIYKEEILNEDFLGLIQSLQPNAGIVPELGRGRSFLNPFQFLVYHHPNISHFTGPKRDEVTRGWRKLHNEELHNLYSSLSLISMVKSRRMRWAGHVARMGEKRNAYRILVGNPEGKRLLGRIKRRWVDNIKIDLREIGWDGGDWIDLARDRDQWRALVKAVMNLRVP
jgi:hypothetical protein